MVSYPGGTPLGPSMATPHSMPQYQPQNGMPIGNIGPRGPPMNMAQQQQRMSSGMVPMPQLSNMQTRVVPGMNMGMHKQHDQNSGNRFPVPNCLISPYRLPQPQSATRYNRTTPPQRDTYHVSSTQQFIPSGGPNMVGGNQNSMRGMPGPTSTPPQQQADMQKQQPQQQMPYGMPTQQQTQTRPTLPNYQPYRNNAQQPRPPHHAHRQPSSPIYQSSQPQAPMVYLVTQPYYGPSHYTQRQPGGYIQPPLQNQLNTLVYSYPNPPTHPSCYYPTNGQALPPTSIPGNTQTGRSNPPTPVAPQGVTVPMPAQPVVPHPTAQQPHHHQNPGIRHPSVMPPVAPVPPRRKSCAVSIIDPDTMLEVVTETAANQQSFSEDSSERQTPIPETNSIVEEFRERVMAAVTSPSEDEVDVNTLNLDEEESDVAIDEITPNPQTMDSALVISETPIVSAISDSPEIVPKVKNPIISEQSVTLDPNKNMSNKQQKLVKSGSKSSVPVSEEPQSIIVDGAVIPQPQRLSKRQTERGPVPADKVPMSETRHDSPEPVPIVNGPNDAGKSAVSEELPEISKAASTDPIVITTEPIIQKPILLPLSTEALETVLEVEPELIRAEESSFEEDQSPISNTSSLPVVDISRQSSQNQLSHSDRIMKDIDNGSTKKISDLDTANGNPESFKDNGNYLESDKSESTKVDAKTDNMNITEDEAPELNANHRGQGEKIMDNNQSKTNEKKTEPAKKIELPKYNYKEGQWSPLNQSGRKVYDRDFIMQLQDDSKSRIKPDALNAHPDLVRMKQSEMSFSLGNISRPNNDAFLPSFANIPQSRGSSIKDPRKSATPNKQSSRGGGGGGGGGGASGSMNNQRIFHISLSLHSDVKLNETENAWKPSRFQGQPAEEDGDKAEELYKKFRSVLNKLTPEKFETLLEQVKKLEINTEEKLSKVIDLVFDKAIDEPNFSVAYAKMCKQLSILAVPSQNNPSDQANFRKMLISKCQKQFETREQQSVKDFEKELKACEDPSRRKELELTLEEEKRRVRMKSVGNVRFIGELYKLEMLTPNIMNYCMKYLLDGEENEQQLECLCKLLNTIGAQFEREENDKINTSKVLNDVFNQMQNIVDRKNKSRISSRVRFMLQDVIELRRRRWSAKNEEVPKTMGEIQKEAELIHKNIELINASPMGGGRRDDNRGKRGDSRRGGGGSGGSATGSYEWSKPSNRSYTAIDTSKLKAGTNTNKQVKLAPPRWDVKSASLTAPMSSPISTNKYSVLVDGGSSDPPPLRSAKDSSPTKGASQERNTNKYSRPNNYSGSSSSQKLNANAQMPIVSQAIVQERIKGKALEHLCNDIENQVSNPIDSEFILDVQITFPPQYHVDLISNIIYKAIDKKQDAQLMFSRVLCKLLSNNIVSPENYCIGLAKILEDPDLCVDVPLLNVYLANIVLQPIRLQLITLKQLHSATNTEEINPVFKMKFLAALLKGMRDDMGPSFVKSKWQESELSLHQWMDAEDVPKFLASNKLEFLESDSPAAEGSPLRKLSPEEVHNKLTELMVANTSEDVIKKWIKECAGEESWVAQTATTAIIEHALGPQKKLKEAEADKYAYLLQSWQHREADTLLAIQLLVTRLEHPQGLALSIFKYLSERDIVSQEGFLEWEKSTEPTGKAVMLKGLVSFFTDIKEGYNEDSCGEDTPTI